MNPVGALAENSTSTRRKDAKKGDMSRELSSL
jgi:hypothetical protein